MSAHQASIGTVTRSPRDAKRRAWLSTAALTLGLCGSVPAMEVLIIADAQGDGTTVLQNALTGAGMGVTISPVPEYLYDGTNPVPEPYDAIIHLDGYTTWDDMTTAGQVALVHYVNNGGGFIHGQWNSYEVAIGQMQFMRDLTLFDADRPQHASDVQMVMVAGQESHPVMADLPNPFWMVAAYNSGTVHQFPTQPAVVLMRDGLGNDAVAVREFGQGKIVGFHHAAYGADSTTIGNADVQRLYVNAVAWAGRKPLRPGVPSISLIGSDPAYTESQSAYIDAGAVASDAEDGVLSDAITVNGNVDTTRLGTYTLTYVVSDSDMHLARATRLVNVVDTTPPAIAVVGSTAMSVAYGSSYVDPGATAIDSQDGALTAAIVATGSVDTTYVGAHTITYSVTDRSGNTATAVRTVTVGMPPAPTISCAVAVHHLDPSSHQLINVGFSYSLSSVRPIGAVTVSVTQDEQLISRKSADATLTFNAMGNPSMLKLRAQRQSSGDGRVYLIRVSITDDLGRTATSCCAVTVPKSDSRKWLAAVTAQAAKAVAAGIALPVNSFGTRG